MPVRLSVEIENSSSLPRVRVTPDIGWPLIDYLCEHLRISFSCDGPLITIYFLNCSPAAAQAQLDSWIKLESTKPITLQKPARLSAWIVRSTPKTTSGLSQTTHINLTT